MTTGSFVPTLRTHFNLFALIGGLLLLTACSGGSEDSPPEQSTGNTAPTLADQQLMVAVDTPLTITLGPLTDADGDVVSYSISASANVQTTASDHEIVFQSSDIAVEVLTVTATDGINDPVTGTIEITTLAASGTVYYLSTAGDDNHDGSTGSPWATFAHAWTVLQPGDTLLVADGTYGETLSPTVSGTADNPITIRAENRGGAILQKTEDGPAILINSTTSQTLAYITIDGFIARSKGEYSAISVNSTDNISEPLMTNNVIIRNTGAFGSANQSNTVTVAIARTRDSLFEDMWSYGYGRKSVQLYGSTRVTVRRLVARYDYWDGSGYKPNDPRIGFAVYNSTDGIYENIIVLDSAPDPAGRAAASKAGFAIEGNVTSTSTIIGASGNRWLGCLSLDNDRIGLYSSGVSTGINDNNRIEHFVSWGSTNGMVIHAYTTNSDIRYGTFGNASATGMRINNDSVTDTLLEKLYAVDNGSFPYFIRDQGGFYGLDTTFQDNSATDNGSGADIEPENAPTLDYLIQPTPVATKARGGEIVYRYQDGVLSTDALWPWPNEELIQQHMCNTSDLATVHRIAANGAGWEPQWCASGKTLTRYIWEYLGNPMPAEIY